MTFPNFIVYYKKSNNSYRTYNYETKEFKTVELLPSINQFEVFKGFETTDDALIDFSKKLIEWRHEILEAKNLKIKFDYLEKSKYEYRNHAINVISFCKKIIPKKYKTFNFETIEEYEYEYFKNCHNGDGKKGTYDITTYDYSGYYPRIIGSKNDTFEIPTTKGIIKKMTNKKKFEYGIYNVEIRSNDRNFNKVFMFSKDNYYTHYSLNFLLRYIKKHPKADITINLLDINYLSYETTVKSSDIFNNWYMAIYELKKEFPKNKLVKNLSSALHGYLSAYDKIYVKDEDITEEHDDLLLLKFIVKNDYTLNHFVNRNKIYKHQLRIQSFLVSYGRAQLAEVALKNIDDVVRIYTDSISYINNVRPREAEYRIHFFNKDEAKTGKFQIHNCINVERL